MTTQTLKGSTLMVIHRPAKEYELLPWFVDRVWDDGVLICESVAAFSTRKAAEEYLQFISDNRRKAE